MNYYWRFFKVHKFEIAVFLIVLLAFILRFYNYENRWGLAYDQARDVTVAREALKEHKIPLIGPFSSAGQFVYGPQWFWILAIMISLYPFSYIAPWVMQALLYVLMVFLMIVIGKELINKKFGLLLGLLTAVSPAQIGQSINLTSPSMVSIFCILTLYFFIKYLKNDNKIYAFLLGFSLSTAINIHFQAIGLLAFIPIALFFGKRDIKKIAFLFLGVFIPFIPLVIFDFITNHFESKNILDYYMYGQYKIYVPNRWLTYLSIYWPTSWARIIGGEVIIAYAILVLSLVYTVYAFYKRKISKILVAIFTIFLLMVLMLRYYRGERYDSYLVFTHPFVLLISGWTIFQTLRIQKVIAIIFLGIVVLGSFRIDYKEATNAYNYMMVQTNEWTAMLKNTHPGKKFAVYDYRYRSTGYSLPFVLKLQEEGMIDDNGYKIGFGNIPKEERKIRKRVKEVDISYEVWGLEGSTSAQLKEEGWAFINPSQVYKSTVEWYKKDNL